MLDIASIKIFKIPPKKSENYENCIINCNQPHCLGLHYIKCDVPGCGYIATHKEQHSKAIHGIRQHKRTGKCKFIQANIGNISGNNVQNRRIDSQVNQLLVKDLEIESLKSQLREAKKTIDDLVADLAVLVKSINKMQCLAEKNREMIL